MYPQQEECEDGSKAEAGYCTGTGWALKNIAAGYCRQLRWRSVKHYCQYYTMQRLGPFDPQAFCHAYKMQYFRTKKAGVGPGGGGGGIVSYTTIEYDVGFH